MKASFNEYDLQQAIQQFNREVEVGAYVEKLSSKDVVVPFEPEAEGVSKMTFRDKPLESRQARRVQSELNRIDSEIRATYYYEQAHFGWGPRLLQVLI